MAEDSEPKVICVTHKPKKFEMKVFSTCVPADLWLILPIYMLFFVRYLVFDVHLSWGGFEM